MAQGKTLKFRVAGMTCAACSARVERAASTTPGVAAASVNLLKGTLAAEVAPEADAREVARAVESAVKAAGYGAESTDGTIPAPSRGVSDSAEEDPAKALLKRFALSLAFLLPLMYVSMGAMMGLPMPALLAGDENVLLRAILQLFLATPPLVLNGVFFTKGFKTLLRGSPNMDSLIAVGAGAGYVYGLAALLAAASAAGAGDWPRVVALLHGLYFEGAAMIVTLITFGKFLEARAKGKTTSAIEALTALAPRDALVLRDGREVRVPREEVKVGDIVVLKTGSTVPVDGEVVSGSGLVDESAMTGESIPVEKKTGDGLLGATLVAGGRMEMRAQKVGADTALAQIIRLVDEATSSKAPVARLADRVSGVFVPVVIGIAAATLAAWLLLGAPLGTALERAISVLVISCPCALGLATPTAIMVGMGAGAKRGILFKRAAALETLSSIDAVVLDKTGTVTEGKPRVSRVIPAALGLELPLLMTAASLERLSEHPLGGAIVRAADERHLPAQPVEDFKQHEGRGISGRIGAKTYFAGNARFARELGLDIPDAMSRAADDAARSGETPLFVGVASGSDSPGSLLGLLTAADAVKSDSAAAVSAMKSLGLDVTLLTGDQARTARRVADEVGIESVRSDVLPAEKAGEVERLKASGRRVLMVGDGVNDAPALAAADAGAAIGAGTDVAIASADIVLMKSSLAGVPEAVQLSRAVMRNIRENLFWAFFYNAVGIPVAAGCFASFGLTLNPMIAAAAMSLSSFSVVTNALRLRRFRPRTGAQALDFSNPHKPEGKVMKEKIISIEGMHCGHCTANVEKSLSALPGVAEAKADLETKSAKVKVEDFVTDDMLKAVVEGIGFKVTGVR